MRHSKGRMHPGACLAIGNRRRNGIIDSALFLSLIIIVVLFMVWVSGCEPNVLTPVRGDRERLPEEPELNWLWWAEWDGKSKGGGAIIDDISASPSSDGFFVAGTAHQGTYQFHVTNGNEKGASEWHCADVECGFFGYWNNDATVDWIHQLNKNVTQIALDTTPDNKVVVASCVEASEQEDSDDAVCFLEKFDKDFTREWSKKITGGTINQISAVHILNDDFFVITGSFRGALMLDAGNEDGILTSQDAVTSGFVAKYNNEDGHLEWSRSFGNSGGAAGIDVKGRTSREIFVTGRFQSGAAWDANDGEIKPRNYGDSDIFIAKYDGEGDVKWVNGIGGPGPDAGVSIVISDEGSILVGARFERFVLVKKSNGTRVPCHCPNVTDTNWCQIISKYKNNGEHDWAEVDGGGNTVLRDMVGDTVGRSLITTGSFKLKSKFGDSDLEILEGADFGGNPNLYIATIDTGGATLWLKKVVSQDPCASGPLALLSNGSLLVSGTVMGEASLRGVSMVDAEFGAPGVLSFFIARFD